MKKVICGVYIFLIFILTGCKLSEEYCTRNINEYRNFTGHISKEENDMFSGLMIFPETMTEDMEDAEYYYECGNFALDNNYLICFVCKWNEHAFERELERLKKLEVIYNGKKKQAVLEESRFEYPAYVTIFDEELCSMEYALIDEENGKIIYMFSQLYTYNDLETKIDTEYIPKKDTLMSCDKLQNGYNIYYFEDKDGIGVYIKENE